MATGEGGRENHLRNAAYQLRPTPLHSFDYYAAMLNETKKLRYVNQKHQLTMDQFSLKVFIGCHDAERENSQEVRLQIIVRDQSLLQAAFSDDLQDTFCYAEILEKLRSHCLSRHFNLVENLAASCYEFLKQEIGRESEIYIRLHKVEPPVAGLEGGVVFEFGDFR